MIAAQGDLLVMPQDKGAPPDATLVAPGPDGNYVIAPSANGHPHVLVGAVESVYFKSGTVDVFYVKATDAALIHKRADNPHRPLPIHGEVQIRRQREMTPEGWANVID